MAGMHTSPTSVILATRGSGSKQHGLVGERGIASLIIIAIIAVLALFGFSAMAAINWKFILALFAMGIVGLSVVGVLFFKANWNMVMLAAVVSFGIIFIIEVTFPVLVGGLMVIFAMWQFKLLKGQPLMFVGLVGIGLTVMLLGAKLALYPLGIMP